MFKNLSPKPLGVSGRQSELIELALTYGFRGLDVDIADFAKRVEMRGLEHTARYLQSAQHSMNLRVAGFELPARWQADEISFKEAMGRLAPMMEIAQKCGMGIAYTTVMPALEGMPFNQGFDFHCKRLTEVAELLAEHDVRLGLGFLPTKAHREDVQYECIYQVEQLLALVKAINRDNVGVIFDTWNWHFGQGTFDQVRELGCDKIIAVRLADAPADTQPDTVQDTDRLLPLAEGGLIDNTGALQMLGEMEYDGPVSVNPQGQKFAVTTREKIVQQAATALDIPWKAAGLNRAGKLAPEEEEDDEALVSEATFEEEALENTEETEDTEGEVEETATAD